MVAVVVSVGSDGRCTIAKLNCYDYRVLLHELDVGGSETSPREAARHGIFDPNRSDQ